MTGEIRVSSYGAVGDNDADDTSAIQAAVDEAIARQLAGRTSVVILDGRHKITSPIMIAKLSGGAHQYVSLAMRGRARGYVGGQRTALLPTFLDKPALIIQQARSVELSDFSIVGGANPGAVPSYGELLAGSWYNTGEARDNRYSPYCGIAIDPFGTEADESRQYPGLSAHYNNTSGGSTAVNVINVESQQFICGIAISTAAAAQLGDSIVIDRCDLSYNKVPVAVGQSQNRGVEVKSPHIKVADTAFDSVRYGSGNAPMPIVSGGVALLVKRLFVGDPGWGQGAISDLYCESLLSLGTWGEAGTGFAMTLRDCHLKMYPVPEGEAAIDTHLHAGGPVIFRGGYFGQYLNESRRLSVRALTAVYFDRTVIDGEPVAAFADKIDVGSAMLRYHNSLRVEQVYEADLTETVIGVFAITISDGSYTIDGAGVNQLSVGDYVIAVGDWFGEAPSGATDLSYSSECAGRVSAIDGTTATIVDAPVSLGAGTYSIRKYQRAAL